MPFALRFVASPLPFKASAVSIEIDGAGFHDTVSLPRSGTVITHDYPASSTDYKLNLKFHVGDAVVHISVDHLGTDDTLFVFAEPNHPPAMSPGARFVGTIWHGTTGHEQREHCTVTCEADNKTADCCIICTNGSTTAKICC